MAYEIGERVASTFTGPGTVKGPMVKDDGEAFQLIKFDSNLFGERLWRISKLSPYVDPKVKLTSIQKTIAAITEYDSSPEALRVSDIVKQYGTVSPVSYNENTLPEAQTLVGEFGRLTWEWLEAHKLTNLAGGSAIRPKFTITISQDKIPADNIADFKSVGANFRKNAKDARVTIDRSAFWLWHVSRTGGGDGKAQAN